jgi:hypothetical protein
MGELIEFRKDRAEVWSDSGELPDEAPADSPRLRLLMLPILLFLDALAAVLAIICRPVAASIAGAGALVLWVGLRDVVGFDSFWTLLICLGLWLVAHVLGHDLDRLFRLLEAREAGLMRAAGTVSPALGRAVHLVLYLYAALVPGTVLLLLTGALRLPRWVPESLHSVLDFTALPILIAALPLAVTAIVTRYRWHPIARHATLAGNRRKLTLAA